MRTERVQHIVGGGQTLQKDAEEPRHLHPWGCLNACSDPRGPAPSRTLGGRHPELLPSPRYREWLFSSYCVCRVLVCAMLELWQWLSPQQAFGR